jgi:Transposase DDE domain
LTQARGKLSEKMCRDLFQHLAGEATHVSSHAQLSYRGFSRIVAVDGTKLLLSSTPALKRDFGCLAGEHLAPQALLSLLWDVGGNVPIDWRVGPCAGSEQTHLDEMMSSLRVGDLLLADRLYPSRASFVALQHMGVHFIMRIKSQGRNLSRESQTFIASDKNDETVTLPEYPGLILRFIRYRRTGHDDLFFVTSLPAQTHSAQAIADLYQRRWSVETAYREGKLWHGLNELPGKSAPMIRQEICALMIFWLMQGELEGQARRVYADEIAQQPPVDKAVQPAEGISEIPVQFNRRLAATSIALLMAAAVTSLPQAAESWHISIRYLWQNRARRKPGRHFRRTSQRPHQFKMRDEESRKLGLKRQKKGKIT